MMCLPTARETDAVLPVSSSRASAAVFRRSLCCLMSLALLVIAGSAANADDGDDESGSVASRGVEYGLMVGFGVHTQGLDGYAISPDSLPAIRDLSGGAPGDSATTPFLSVAATLFMPEDLLGTSAFAPRLLLDFGADFQLDNQFRASAFNFGKDGADVGDFCPGAGPNDACSYESRVRVDVIANFYAGAGFDFALPFQERRYHVMPGFGYFGQAYDSNGYFTLSGSDNLASEDVSRIDSSSDTEFLHGLYGRLGLGVDVWEAGPFTSRLSVNGRAAYILSDRETTYSGTNPDDTPFFNQADFMARPSGWVFTVYAGVEVRYDPNRR